MLNLKKVLLIALCLIFVIGLAAGCTPGGSEAVKQEEAETDGISFNSVMSFANWTTNSRIYENALNALLISQKNPGHMPVYKFDTKTDFDNFRKEFSDVFTLDYSSSDAPSLNSTATRYDDSFFDTGTLLLCYLTAGSSSYRFNVASVTCGNNSLCISVEETDRPEVATCDMAGWFILVEVKKADVQNCTEYDAELINTK